MEAQQVLDSYDFTQIKTQLWILQSIFASIFS